MKKSPIAFSADATRAMPPKLASAWKQAQAAMPSPRAAANELCLYGQIGVDWWTGEGITPESVNEWLAALPSDVTEITVRINSPGGSVFDGIGIYNALVNCGKRVVVKIDALAASIASVIAMAGDDIIIAGNAQMMIHKAWTISMGNADDLLREAATLESIDSSLISTYAARTNQKPDAIGAMMAAETWLNAETAKEKGFADRVEALKTKGSSASDEAAAKAAALKQTLRNRHALMKMRAACAA